PLKRSRAHWRSANPPLITATVMHLDTYGNICNLRSREGSVDVARSYRYAIATRVAPTSRPDHCACDSTPPFQTSNALDSIGRSLGAGARTLDFGMVCRRSRRADHFRMDTERSDSACRIMGRRVSKSSRDSRRWQWSRLSNPFRRNRRPAILEWRKG